MSAGPARVEREAGRLYKRLLRGITTRPAPGAGIRLSETPDAMLRRLGALQERENRKGRGR